MGTVLYVSIATYRTPLLVGPIILVCVLGMCVEGQKRSILRLALRLGLPAGAGDGFGIKGRDRKARVLAGCRRVHVGRARRHSIGMK